MSSEIARLRQQIELECIAMQQALTGFAIVSKHEIIQKRYEAIGHYQEQLQALVGETEAALIVIKAYAKVLE